MSLLVVGSVAIDSIRSPAGDAPDVLGGSATHFALAASFFTPVRLVSVVGEDFPDEFLDIFEGRPVDLSGIERARGRSFRWTGRYEGAMAIAETLSVELNTFGSFDPKVPDDFRDTRYLFLANGAPVVQRTVIERVPGARFRLMDTMNLWIETARRDLLDTLGRVDALVINDEELRQLTGEANLVRAGRGVLEMGPRAVIVKKGEHGALLFYGDQVFAAPAFPVEELVDPTGAGDSFAGGVMGTIARSAETEPTFETLRRAVAVGIVTASFNVEDFGTARLARTSPAELRERYALYRGMLDVEGEPALLEGAAAS